MPDMRATDYVMLDSTVREELSMPQLQFYAHALADIRAGTPKCFCPKIEFKV
jgi:hypothetical protein